MSLRVAYVTAGGAGMYCGSCMRDNTLAATLIRQGVPITLVPTFTPIRVDEQDVSIDRVFLGGVNVYLNQQSRWMRRLPGFLRRGLDHPALLRAVSKMSLQRRREEDAAIAVSLLRGIDGRHAQSVRELVDFIVNSLDAELVNATNLLIAGFASELRRRRKIPIVVTLQGDDIFLDGLSEEGRQAVLTQMRRVAQQIDAFVVFNRFYRDRMAAMLRLPIDRFHLVPLGLANAEKFAPKAPPSSERPPTIGYLARICPEKGFHRAVDAFLQLRERLPTVRLRAAGWLGASDRPFFEEQQAKLERAGALDAFDHVEVPDLPTKMQFLHSIDLFTLPTTYEEPKGLPVLEALAAGVPVVLPRHGAFPELIESTGGGLLVDSTGVGPLVGALQLLLTDPGRRSQLAQAGRSAVIERHRDQHMADRTMQAWLNIAAKS